MAGKIKAKLTSLLLILVSCITQAQDFAPLVIKDNVHIELAIEKHLWLDSNTYQFIAISVTGLPEINTIYSQQSTDTINLADLPSLINRDPFSGGYGPAIPISRNQTFQPIKTIKEIVYDTISKSNKVKYTSLFLLDDFNKIKRRETLILVSRGCFGHQRQSYADCNNFTSVFHIDKTLLDTDNSCPIADENWYEEWLKNASKDYRDSRMTNQYGEIIVVS